MFDSIITTAGSITARELIICLGVSLVLGIAIALIHMYKNEYSRNLILTLVVLPVIVQTVIMLVNGSIGTGLAVMGAFTLVRFRSTPGNAREITAIFTATAVGLAIATGYIGIGVLLVIVVGLATILLASVSFGDSTVNARQLKIVIPEDLDYEGIFDDIFEEYTKKCELMKVRTTNMGSLYELHYRVLMKKDVSEKAFIDSLRCRNGNLNILLGRATTSREDL